MRAHLIILNKSEIKFIAQFNFQRVRNKTSEPSMCVTKMIRKYDESFASQNSVIELSLKNKIILDKNNIKRKGTKKYKTLQIFVAFFD